MDPLLPAEIEREIVLLAARSFIPCVPPLCLVAKRFRKWISPLIIELIIQDRNNNIICDNLDDYREVTPQLVKRAIIRFNTSRGIHFDDIRSIHRKLQHLAFDVVNQTSMTGLTLDECHNFSRNLRSLSIRLANPGGLICVSNAFQFHSLTHLFLNGNAACAFPIIQWIFPNDLTILIYLESRCDLVTLVNTCRRFLSLSPKVLAYGVVHNSYFAPISPSESKGNHYKRMQARIRSYLSPEDKEKVLFMDLRQTALKEEGLFKGKGFELGLHYFSWLDDQWKVVEVAMKRVDLLKKILRKAKYVSSTLLSFTIR